MQRIQARVGLALITGATMLACSSGEMKTAYADSAPSKKGTELQNSAAQPGQALRLVLSPAGTAARYRVREQLMGNDLPNDAIGETKTLNGAISFDSSGKVIRQSSRFVVNAGTFVSDKNRRDDTTRS